MEWSDLDKKHSLGKYKYHIFKLWREDYIVIFPYFEFREFFSTINTINEISINDWGSFNLKSSSWTGCYLKPCWPRIV